MNRSRLAPIALTTIALAMNLVLSSCGSSLGLVVQATATAEVAQNLQPLRTDGTPIPLADNNLLGKTPAEIGQIVLQEAIANGDSVSGTPQVVLARFITRQDLSDLGLGCITDWGYIEEPPLALVILKGTLTLSSFGGAQTTKPLPVPYIAYVYDLWAGGMTAADASPDSGHYKKALNDPTLPNEVSPLDMTCPTWSLPRRHYGDELPGIIPPTGSPAVPTDEPLPTEPALPTALPTKLMPVVTPSTVVPAPLPGTVVPVATLSN